MKQLKKIVRKSLPILGMLLLSTAFVLLLSGAGKRYEAQSCSGTDIRIEDKQGIYFIDNEDVVEILESIQMDSLNGIPLQQLELDRMEMAINSLPYIEKANVFCNMSGELCVRIDQRKPLLRVIHNNTVSYYIDIYGQKMPLSTKFTPRVLVATGVLDSAAFHAASGTSKVMGTEEKVYELAKIISEDPFWEAQIAQINITAEGDFELLPVVGNHIIQMGPPSNFEEKLRKLKIFYEQGLAYQDWSKYSVVDLSFKDQVVCTKRK